MKMLDRNAKRLVMYLGSLERGGAQRVMLNLAAYFRSEGYRVTIVTTFRGKEEFDLPEGVQRVLSGLTREEEGRGRLLNIRRRIGKLRAIFRGLQPDLILSFIGKNNVMALEAAKGLRRRDGSRVPVVVSVRSDPAREYASRGLNMAAMQTFSRAAGVVLQTKKAAAYFPPRIRARAIVLPNSVNPYFLRKRYEGEREKRIVAVGRLDDNKDEALLIRAFAKARDKDPDFRLELYGDGPARKKLEVLAKELGLSGAVTFYCNVSDVADRIERAAVYVLPSRQEGMPNALIEAMCLGLACISTDCPVGGPGELIQDGENGLLVPVGDAGAMAEALAELMTETDTREELGRHAAALQRRYAPAVINARWRGYFDGLM